MDLVLSDRSHDAQVSCHRSYTLRKVVVDKVYSGTLSMFKQTRKTHMFKAEYTADILLSLSLYCSLIVHICMYYKVSIQFYLFILMK